MRLTFLIVPLLLLTGPAAGQDYLLYHTWINRAEQFITEDRADSAFHYYDKAFDKFPFIFIKDAYIAAQLAWQQRNKERTFRYLIRGAEGGLKSSCLDLSPVLRSAMNERFYEELYDSMRAANRRHLNSIDPALGTEWRARLDEQMLDEDAADQLTTIEKNTAELKKLLYAGKYPGEALIGISAECDAMGNYCAFYVLANYDCAVTELHDQLWAAVRKGQMHPREFATLWEWEYVRSARNVQLLTRNVMRRMLERRIRVLMGENLYMQTNRNCDRSKQRTVPFSVFVPRDDVPEAEVDKNRASYSICSLETDRKKKKLEAEQGFVFFFENK